MLKCKICLAKFQVPRYRSSRISICGRCANDLNGYRETAESAYKSVRELLLNGMLRRATIAVSTPSTPKWEQERAARDLEELDEAVDRALPKWINKLVADESNKTKFFKIIRAHRRGLLHEDRPHRWGYPKNWKDVASNIRELDGFTCVACSATDCELHVHHIVYVSNFGTHQKSNLITLCRECHEKEHKRVFDFGENMVETDEPPPERSIDQETLLEEGIQLAAHYFESGVHDFSWYANLMVKDVGREITPFLLSFWEALRHHPSFETGEMTNEAESARLFEVLLETIDASSSKICDQQSIEMISSDTDSSNLHHNRPQPQPQPQPQPVTVVVSREEIDAQNVSLALGTLKKFIDSPEVARSYFERVDIAIHGFNETSIELYEIPAVRDFMHSLDEQFPYWLFFLCKSSFALQFVTQCFLAPFMTQQGKKSRHLKQLEQLLLSRWFPALNEVCEWVGFSEEQIEKVTDASIDYLIGGSDNLSVGLSRQ